MSAPTYLSSLRTALQDLLTEREDVLLLGEDLADPYGGAFKVTLGLSSRFPGRVLSSPISEAALVGVATGLALRGFRPVVEVMFGDFLFLAADQLLNGAAKFPLMFPEAKVPLVVRTPMGGGRGYGPTHSQSIEKHFLGAPGLTVVSPSPAHDPGALLRHCVTGSAQPVLFVEYKNLYPRPLCQGGGGLVVRTPPGQGPLPAAVVENFASGRPDVVVVSYGGASAHALDLLTELAAEEIRVRAVLPSLLSAPLPAALAAAEVACGCPVVVAEAGTAGFTWGAEVAATLREQGHPGLGPVRRLASRDGVVPAAAPLEAAALLGTAQLREAILGCLR